MNCEHCKNKIEPKKKVLCKSCSEKARQNLGQTSVYHCLPESHQEFIMKKIQEQIHKQNRSEELLEELLNAVYAKILISGKSENSVELEKIITTLSKISKNQCAEWFVNEYATNYYLQQRMTDIFNKSIQKNDLIIAKQKVKKKARDPERKSDNETDSKSVWGINPVRPPEIKSDQETDSATFDIFDNYSPTPADNIIKKQENDRNNILRLLIERQDNCFFFLVQYIKFNNLDIAEFIIDNKNRKEIAKYFNEHNTEKQWKENDVTNLMKRLKRFIEKLKRDLNQEDFLKYLDEISEKNKEGYYGLKILINSIPNHDECMLVMNYMQEHQYDLYALINRQCSQQDIQKIAEDLSHINNKEPWSSERVSKVLENVYNIIAYWKNQTGTRIEKEEDFAEYLINVHHKAKTKKTSFSVQHLSVHSRNITSDM